MIYPRIALNWILPPLTALERTLLGAVGARLGPDAAARFAGQVERVNYVQRRENGRDVGLYVIRRGKPFFDPDLRLPAPDLEHELARLRFRAADRQWRARVHLVRGQLASIEYDAIPPRHDAAVTVDLVEVRDPQATVAAPKGEARSASLPPWLEPLAASHGPIDADPPLDAAEREMRLARLEVELPDDYLELLRHTDGLQVGPVAITGLRESYFVNTAAGRYLVIGQAGGEGILAIPEDGSRVVLLDFESGEVRASGTVRQILDRLLEAR